ncbi:MAG TPA: Calx-beta domain-containing protein, partial [Tepidisphaeraceae bacterium]|nr:Calx-beta domain-containing protein [Tepidisphaeraceae bacterium]
MLHRSTELHRSLVKVLRDPLDGLLERKIDRDIQEKSSGHPRQRQALLESLEARRLLSSTSMYEMEFGYAGIHDVSTDTWAEDSQLPFSGADGSYTLHVGNLPPHAVVQCSFTGEASYDLNDADTEKVTLTAAGKTDEWDFTDENLLDFGVGVVAPHISDSIDVTLDFEGFGDGEGWTLWFGNVTVIRPSASISTFDGDVTEATTGDKLTFRVTRTDTTVGDLQVSLASPAGTASNGTDYSAIPSTVTIPDGSDHKDFDLTAIDDPTAEGDESVILSLADPGTTAPYTASPAPATAATVHDNVSVASIAIEAANPPPQREEADPNYRGFNGFVQWFNITVVGERLSDVWVKQDIVSQLRVQNLDTGEELAGAQLDAFGTDQFVNGSGPDWAGSL